MTRGLNWFLTKYPDWQDYLKVEEYVFRAGITCSIDADVLFACRTILKGVPSNNQLTLTLLRIGEDHNVPLPPPPKYTGAPPERSPSPIAEEDLPSINPDTADRDLSHDDEYHYAGIDLNDDGDTAVEDDSSHDALGVKKTKKRRLVNFVKGSAKTAVTAIMGADRVKATVGSEKSKERQGVLRSRKYVDGPSMFRCRHSGKKGWAIIVSGVS